MIKRLRNRFIRIATLSVAAVMLLLTVILNVANFVSINSDLTRTLTMISENQGTIPHADFTAAPPEPKGDRPAPNGGGGPFTQETPFSTRFFVLWYDADGTLTQKDMGHIASVTEDEADTYLNIALTHGTGSGFYGSYKYSVTQNEDGSYMAVFLDCYQEQRSMRTVLMWSFVADAACILLVLVLVVVLSRKAIDPVVRTAKQQKQFITDASHELKTPITVIATSLRVLEMEVGQQKWITKALAQTEKLTELVNSLVTLSRMDEEDSPLKAADFDISNAVTETAESFRDFAENNGHTLKIDVAPQLTYHGDEYAVRQLVSILLDNAVKYALADSVIELRLTKSRKGVTLYTKNACEPIPQETANRLFDRFYRADPSRNKATGGFGIGLSIARSIAEGHHGKILAACKQDGESSYMEFTVELR